MGLWGEFPDRSVARQVGRGVLHFAQDDIPLVLRIFLHHRLLP
jgi:hypothetical protein